MAKAATKTKTKKTAAAPAPEAPRRPALATLGNAVNDIRSAITTAEAQGVKRDNLRLRLTHRDASLLKRSKDVADDEISFEGGEMSFLGIPVEIGSTPVSELTTAA
ncbi:MAG: hypothetical protein KA105_05675 [Caulobacter sp.]|jgi:hypothetical protein|nr:hypothetical protein [Caulobacter sp.]